MISKRARIIELGRTGLTKSAIVKALEAEGYDNVSYQYVFNTLKDKAIATPKATGSGTSVRAQIIALAKTGKTRAEIVKALQAAGAKCDYHYVFMITKQAGFKFEPAAKKMDRLADQISDAVTPGAEATPKEKRQSRAARQQAKQDAAII